MIRGDNIKVDLTTILKPADIAVLCGFSMRQAHRLARQGILMRPFTLGSVREYFLYLRKIQRRYNGLKSAIGKSLSKKTNEEISLDIELDGWLKD